MHGTKESQDSVELGLATYDQAAPWDIRVMVLSFISPHCYCQSWVMRKKGTTPHSH